jgi:hypothetical protein
MRQAWREKQTTEVRQWWTFLVERGEAGPAARSRMRDHCWNAFAAATRERFPPEETRMRLRRMGRGPRFLIAICLSLLVALASLTGLFSGVRTLYAALPYAGAGRLVTCYQVHFLSVSLGVQTRYIRPWRNGAATLTGLSAYQVRYFRLTRPGRHDETVAGARVTPDFFTLLGVHPALGRLFESNDSPADSPVVLSHELWRRSFDSDIRLVSKQVFLDGRACRVIGILPPGFWFKSRSLSVWSLLPDFAPVDQVPRLIDAVGRLRPGVTLETARAELEGIASRTGRFQGGTLRVVPLQQSLRSVAQFILSVLLVGVTLALGTAVIQAARSWPKQHGSVSETLRYWAFFFVKSALLLAGSALLCAELSARNALGLQSSKFFVSLLADWASLLGTLLIFRWAILDQARRCPVCLRRLAMPVTLGSWSSPLLEPAATELLCDEGHGSLRFSEAHTTLGEIRRWITLDDSWRDLFEGKSSRGSRGIFQSKNEPEE